MHCRIKVRPGRSDLLWIQMDSSEARLQQFADRLALVHILQIDNCVAIRTAVNVDEIIELRVSRKVLIRETKSFAESIE